MAFPSPSTAKKDKSSSLSAVAIKFGGIPVESPRISPVSSLKRCGRANGATASVFMNLDARVLNQKASGIMRNGGARVADYSAGELVVEHNPNVLKGSVSVSISDVKTARRFWLRIPPSRFC
jgi:hypothetical protein